MGGFRETQGIGDFRHIPVGVLQQGLGFLQDAAGNMFRGGFLRGALYGPVKMIDMNIQLFRKF